MIPLIVGGAIAALFAVGCQKEAETKPLKKAEAAPRAPIPAPAPEAFSACPPEMAQVKSFCIDKYEAHILISGRRHAHNLPPPDAGIQAASERGVFPQAHISKKQAEEACVNAEKRLCKLSEWLSACRGAENFKYPYGNSEVKDQCNSRKPHLLSQLFRGSPATWKYDLHFNNSQLNVTPGFLEKTATHEACVNEYRVFDMVGNLHEWVSDMVDTNLGKKIIAKESVQRRIKDNYGHGIFMGGFYSTGIEHGEGCGFITIGHEPQYHDYSTGFRCCQDAEEPQASL